MNDHHRDEDHLRGLLQDAVREVEPDHRLDEIRAAIRGATAPTKVRPMTARPPTRRPWLLGALGAAVATAAVIGVVAVLTHGPDDDAAAPAGTSTTPPVSTSPSAAATSDSSAPSPTAATSAAAGGAGSDARAMAVYYVGTGPRGPALYREFHRVSPSDAVAQTATSPQDGDYRADWQAGDVVSSADLGSTLQVTLGSTSLRARPAGMSAAEAATAVQALVYTAQATYQSRAAVQFTVGSQPLTELYGVRLDGPLKAAAPLRTLSLMSITAPSEGQSVTGSLTASGVSNGVEANVVWRLKQGDHVVRQGATTAAGWMGDQLFPWQVSIPLAGVPAGTYTFETSTDDPSGAGAVDTDSRTVTVG